jgi:carboxylate-amine ligase
MMELRMTYTVGIEQEFFVVSEETLECVGAMPEAFFRTAYKRLGPRVCKELLGSMVELVSGVHRGARAAVSELMDMRSVLVGAARAHGLALIASGTHPFADWHGQVRNSGGRYTTVGAAMAGLTQRAHVCGIHVHIGIGSLGARIDLMNRMQPLLPMFLALTASSPLWRGKHMGVQSYRAIGYGEGPRTGIPGRFSDIEAYRRLMAAWKEAGILEDESFCWWWIRPSHRYATLEIRIADSCVSRARIELLVALCRSSAHYLTHNPDAYGAYTPTTDAIVRENLWQAARDGWESVQVDVETLRHQRLREHTKAWVERIMPSAAEIGESDILQEHSTLFDRENEAALAGAHFMRASRLGQTGDAPARETARRLVAELHGAAARSLLDAA